MVEIVPDYSGPLEVGPPVSPVPLDHGFGLDGDQRLSPDLPDTVQKNPDHAVLVLQRRARKPSMLKLSDRAPEIPQSRCR